MSRGGGPSCGGRRRLIAGASGLVIGASFQSARAAARPVIVILGEGPARTVQHLIARLGALGWIDGRTADIVFRWADYPALAPVAREMATLRPDIVVATGDRSIGVVRAQIPDVPIVMVASNNPVALGWVQTLRQPGGRITGTAWTQDIQIAAKYVELAADLVPGITRIGAIIDPRYPGIDPYRPPFDETARRMGIAAHWADASTAEQIEPAFAALSSFRAQVVSVFGSSLSFKEAERFAQAALAARLPTIHIFRHAVAAGGLMSYGPSYPVMMTRSADYVDRILRGARPADLPVEQPAVYELIVNLRTAKSIGVKVPATMLARADEVVE